MHWPSLDAEATARPFGPGISQRHLFATIAILGFGNLLAACADPGSRPPQAVETGRRLWSIGARLLRGMLRVSRIDSLPSPLPFRVVDCGPKEVTPITPEHLEAATLRSSRVTAVSTSLHRVPLSTTPMTRLSPSIGAAWSVICTSRWPLLHLARLYRNRSCHVEQWTDGRCGGPLWLANRGRRGATSRSERVVVFGCGTACAKGQHH